MKKLLPLVLVLLSVATAQKMPSQMPMDSQQYKLTQKILSAIHGFEETCDEPSKQLQDALKKAFKTYQNVCGGYFLPSKVPLEAIDRELVEYQPRTAWQRRTESSYKRIYKFGQGEINIDILELTDEAIILIAYQEWKPSVKR